MFLKGIITIGGSMKVSSFEGGTKIGKKVVHKGNHEESRPKGGAISSKKRSGRGGATIILE